MIQVQCVSPARTPTIGGGESTLLAARTELTHALDCALAAYTFDASVRDSVDALVTELRRAGQSVDVVIDAVGASVRANQPAGRLSSDGAGERMWRAYFAFYDMMIQRAIRTFVVGGLDDNHSLGRSF